MRIVMFHNFYKSPGGGEDVSFREETALLRTRGDEVFEFTTSNDEITNVGAIRALKHMFWDAAWSVAQYEEARRALRRWRPDVAHVQNFWFMLTPSVYAACHDEGVPVVQHLRNYRLGCLNGLFLYKRRPCESCLGRRPWPGLLRRCYRNSILMSLAIYHMIMYNRRTGVWRDQVDHYICLTKQSQRLFLRMGLPQSRLSVRPNFLLDPGIKGDRPANGDVLYLGRLSPEKGFDVLVSAWKMLQQQQLRLKVCGGEEDIIARLKDEQSAFGIELVGHLSRDSVMEELRQCRFVVMPTICYENMPRVVVEAFASGTPVIGSDVGAVAEMVEHGKTGLLFEPGKSEDLAQKMSYALSQPQEMAKMGREARREYERKYVPSLAYTSLVDIYQTAIERFAKPRGSNGC